MGFEIVICLAGLISGILAACGIPAGHLQSYLIPVLLAVLASFLWRPHWSGIKRFYAISSLAGFGCFFLAGWVLISVSRFVPIDNQQDNTVIARIVSYRELSDKLGQLLVKVTHERNGPVWEKRTGRMVLMVKPDPGVIYSPGDQWKFGPLKITRVSSKPTKNGFVPGRYWLSRGVCHEARLPSGSAVLIRSGKGVSLSGFFLNWQQTLAGRIDRIPLSEPGRALIKAMILGDRTDISAATMNDFSRAGIIHVISVSGLHVGIIYFMISWLLKRLGFIGARSRSVIALGVVWMYAGITGFSPSALRSAGMITLFEFARLGRRGTPGLGVLAGTALLHCLIDPYALFSAGAQLSYLAVAGIFVWNPVFNPILARFNRVIRYFAGSIAISISAQSLITPVLLFWFGWFPLYFLAGNLVLLPLMIIGFYLGLAITVIDLAGVTIPLLCRVMDFLMDRVTEGAGWLGNLPGNLFQPDGMGWTDLVLYYYILVLIRSYCEKPDPRTVKRMVAGTGILLFYRYSLMFFSG